MVEFLAALLLGATLIPFLVFEKEPKLYAPIYLTVVYLAIAYPIRLLAVRFDLSYIEEDYPGILFDDYLVLSALLAYSIGLVSYFMGYYLPITRWLAWLSKARLPLDARADKAWPIKVAIVAAIGWGSFALQARLGMYSSFAASGEAWTTELNQLFVYLFYYCWIAYTGACAWLFSRQRQLTLIGIVASAGVIACGLGAGIFVLGYKTWIAYPILWLILIAYMSGRKVSLLLAVGVMGAALLFAFWFVPLWRENYLDVFGEGTVSMAETVRLGRSGLEEYTFIDSETVLGAIAGLLNRLAGMDNAAQLMSFVPDVFDYRYFKDLLFVAISIIPRLIFPDKPVSDIGVFYSVEIAGMLRGGSAAAHPVAEGFMNLGFLGVAIQFWCWGTIQSLFYRGFYLPRKDNPLVVAIYAFYVLQLVGFGQWFFSWLVGVPAQVVVLIPLILIMRSKKLDKIRRSRDAPVIARLMGRD